MFFFYNVHCAVSFSFLEPKGAGDDVDIKHNLLLTLQDTELTECLLNVPEVAPERPFLLDCGTIATAQADDAVLQPFIKHKPEQCQLKDIEKGMSLVTCCETPESKPRICLPNSMIDEVIALCHKVQGHTCMD